MNVQLPSGVVLGLLDAASFSDSGVAASSRRPGSFGRTAGPMARTILDCALLDEVLTGDSTPLTVPDLRGQPIGAVTSSLIPLGLRFTMDGMEPSNTVPMNSIISQNPAPGSRVPPGTTIEVTVSRGPSPFGNSP